MTQGVRSNMRCKQNGYALAEDARPILRDVIKLESMDVKGFGNARGIRNLFERAVTAQANRLASDPEITKEDLMTFTADDVRALKGEC